MFYKVCSEKLTITLQLLLFLYTSLVVKLILTVNILQDGPLRAVICKVYYFVYYTKKHRGGIVIYIVI